MQGKANGPIIDKTGIGLTTWSPLASGLLTGKYASGVPSDSRGALPGYEWLQSYLVDPQKNETVRQLVEIASDLGCTPAQMAIAWCTLNPAVSTVITGASKVSQVEENLKALDVIALLDDDVVARIEKVTEGAE